MAIDLGKTSGQKQKFVSSSYTSALALKGSFENATGSAFDDLFKGNSSANHIQGQGGNDTIYGSSGADTLFGGDGNDWLYGDADNDILYGGTGNNVLLGGDGNDLLDTSSGIVAGRAGRNLLIGGKGLDMLEDAGEGILIGGMTRYDSNAAALVVVLNEWTSSNSRENRQKQFGERHLGFPRQCDPAYAENQVNAQRNRARRYRARHLSRRGRRAPGSSTFPPTRLIETRPLPRHVGRTERSNVRPPWLLRPFVRWDER